MDFREHQDLVHRNSIKIWILFFILLLFASTLISTTVVALVAVNGYYADGDNNWQMGTFSEYVLSNPEFLSSMLTNSVVISSILLGMTLWGWTRNSNGHEVAKAFRGILISEDSTNLSSDQRQALNIVHEQALAASHATPALYIIPDSAINAFAAGKTPEQSVIAITQGALEKFNRTQLAGVIAHEMGHIVNQDIRLNIKIAALVFSFTAIFLFARIALHQTMFSRGDSRSKLVMLLLSVVLIAIGLFTLWMGRLLQAAMSRQREYLADASAVQFTRYPDGLIEAFEVLKSEGAKASNIDNPIAREHSHALMFGMSGELFATHPSLDKRIARLKQKGSPK